MEFNDKNLMKSDSPILSTGTVQSVQLIFNFQFSIFN